MTQKWDAIIIGSGLGGLTTGTLLSKAGKKVLILERHSVPGGFTHTFSRKGFNWDVGVHYVGQVHEKNSILRKIFNYVSEGAIEWAPVGEVYDEAILEGNRYLFVNGAEAQINQLIQKFPDEAFAIRKYIKTLRGAAACSAWYFSEKTMPLWMSKTVGRFLRSKFEKHARLTTYEVLSKLTQNKELISVLCAQCGDYGLLPKESSFGIHAMVVDHYLAGASYPVGGAKKIHDGILGVFRKNGGELRLKTEVKCILTEKGKVTGVELASGEKFYSPVVLSNAGVIITFSSLVPAQDVETLKIRESFKTVRASTAHVCLYLGLNQSDEALKLPKRNFWIYDNARFAELDRLDDSTRHQLTYISFPSAKDPDWNLKHQNSATVQVITACSYEQVKEWENGPWMKRGDAYLDFKKRMIDHLTKKLIEAVPEIEGTIEYRELSTPLSTKHFMNYQRGEIYGLDHTPERFSLPFLRPRTHIPGLYLTGQDIVSVGVGGALYSGVLTATSVLKKSMILRILLSRSKVPSLTK